MVDLVRAALLGVEVLHERAPELVAETCGWSVGLSDLPHYEQRDGRVVASGDTLGLRASGGQSLSTEGTGRFELGDAAPGSFQDALNALAPGGGVHADRFDQEVLSPFALSTGVRAAERPLEPAQPTARGLSQRRVSPPSLERPLPLMITVRAAGVGLSREPARRSGFKISVRPPAHGWPQEPAR